MRTSRQLPVAIVSLFGLYNFGNRLQGFAIDHMLKRRGVHPVTLVLYRKLGISWLKDRLISSVESLRSSPRAVKRGNFERFVKCQEIRYVMVPSQIPRLKDSFAKFVVGSDQVWNPQADLYKRTKFLEFARPAQRIALAPSLGVAHVPEDLRDEYIEALAGFERISVREDAAVVLLETELGVTAETLPDPTFGLDADEWLAVSDHQYTPENSFIFVYFLGGMSEAAHAAVAGWSKRLGAQIVDVSNTDSPYWRVGPQHFLSMISRAEIVLTDSFHAAVFSSIFSKPFYVFRRTESHSTYSRIGTLLDHLDLRCREAHRMGGGVEDWPFDLPDRSGRVRRLQDSLHRYLDEVL